MTYDDIALEVEELHYSLLDWAHETAMADTLDVEQARAALAAIADSIDRLPPAHSHAWANHLWRHRRGIKHAITLLRAAQRENPTDAAAALRDYLEGLCPDN